MPTAEQVKSLVRSHYSNDAERFRTIVLQMAAHEAKQGRSAVALELRDILDSEQQKRRQKTNPFSSELLDLVSLEEADTPITALVIPDELRNRIDRIILEYRQRSILKSHGLEHRRKVLLIGPPGTGKTMTAHVLARSLGLPLYTIQMDRLVTKFMGESSARLRQVFDLINQELGVFLFDEFDAIGGERSMDNDVGEMRRVLNAFLHFVDQDKSDSLVVAATNNARLLDKALFRRFDDILYYALPTPTERKRLIGNLLGTFMVKRFVWKGVLAESEGLSHAEIDQASRDAVKRMILANQTSVSSADLLTTLGERRLLHERTRVR